MELDVLKEWASLLLNSLAVAAIPVLVTYAVTWLKQQKALLEAQLTSEQLAVYQFVASQAVSAAEQSGLAGLVKDKKSYAVKVASDLLTQYGFKSVNVEQLASLIEAAVWDNINAPVKTV